MINDCIEWRNEALAQGISEIKEILDNLRLVDEIIQSDLKWFGKHCVGKESDSVAAVEELVSKIQRKFHEVQDKKAPCREDFSNIAHSKAMLIINQNNLEMHAEK